MCKMKSLIKTTLLLLALMLPVTAAAYDFEVDGIYYNITGTSTVEVTYKGYDNVITGHYSGEITIPETVTHAGMTYAVTAIGRSAFHYCDDPLSVTIPKSVVFIDHSFSGSSGMTSITVDSENPKYDSRDNCNAVIETATNRLIVGCQNTIIPNSVTIIGNGAFWGCYNLTSVTIPNSITTLELQAFAYCRGLTSVIIPNSVTYIDGPAFDNCSGLTSITVESGNLRYDSRDNCNAIIETASNTLKTGCQNTIIPNSVTSIGNEAFRGCSTLTTLTIPNSVISIAGTAFTDCIGLTSITIPSSVTSIGGAAFANCTALSSVTIPGSVTYIGNNAFMNCVNLTDVYSHISNLTIVSIGETLFKLWYSNNYSARTLHVPQGTAAAYQADEHWYPYFGQIVEMEPETGLIGDVNLDGEVDLADINAVVDIITGSSDYTITADVNGDGEINISDVNAIINIIHEDEALIDEHEWVDLGLPSGTLWATCNVGASAPEEYGDYFAWGETEPKDYYDWSNYKWCNGSLNSLTKYCTKSIYGTVDGKTELDLDDDAANVNWGSSWCMPTLEQMQELCDSCTWQWTTLNGVMGRLVIGPNGNSIFLPASGGFSSQVFNDGRFGYYWSRTLCSPDKWDIPNEGEGPDDAYIQFFGSSRKHVWFDSRCDGQTIRAVRATPTEVRSLYIEQQSLDLGVMPVETTHTGELTIVNNTSLVQNLTVSIDEPFSLKQEQGTASSMTIEVPANSRSTVTVMFTATAPGEFNGTATFLNPALDGGQCVIPVKAQSIPQCDYVDLGLPSGTLWATCNVGASAPEEYGDHFAWGETESKEVYKWETYKWCNGSDHSLTKYCTNSDFGSVDNRMVLDLEDDAAYVNMGPSWRMPTNSQQTELIQKCTWQWTTMNGVNGRLVTGPNGNSIFLPAAGERFYNSLLDAGSMSEYWSCELGLGSSICAYGIGFESDRLFWISGARAFGRSVRAVRVSQD